MTSAADSLASPVAAHGDMALPSYSSRPPLAAQPAPRLSRRIDTRKLKTKMCAYVLRGRHCPYGAHCAFAHESKAAPEMPMSPVSQQTLQSLTSDESVGSEDERNRSGESDDDTIRVIPVYVAEKISRTPLPPPPSYEEVVGACETLLPPSYPTRFRFNPYTYEGVVCLD